MEAQILASLKQWFGYDSFLDHQLPVVKSVLSGKDLCVVMPTGAGKSLCYQLPLLMKKRYSIIVSPLISLMKDQVDALLERNIPAAFINTTVPPAAQYAITYYDVDLNGYYTPAVRWATAARFIT